MHLLGEVRIILALCRSLRRLSTLLVLAGVADLTAAPSPAPSGPFSDPVAPVSDPRLQIPANVRPLLAVWMRDSYVTDGGDAFYYLTGTTAAPGRRHCQDWNDGLHLWRSRDLKSWDHLGLVWSLDRDATWQRAFGKAEPGRKAPSGDIMDDQRRAGWAPEIHYIRSRKQWLIAACTNDGAPQKGSFILRSTSGKPEGPYENIAGNATGPLKGCFVGGGVRYQSFPVIGANSATERNPRGQIEIRDQRPGRFLSKRPTWLGNTFQSRRVQPPFGIAALVDECDSEAPRNRGLSATAHAVPALPPSVSSFQDTKTEIP